MPVILITAYASLETALPAFTMPVTAYIRKPINDKELYSHVANSIRQSRLTRAVRAIRRNLNSWCEELDKIDNVNSRGGISQSSISNEEFISLSIQNISINISGIRAIIEDFYSDSSSIDICEHINCPHVERYENWIRKTIEVIKTTKKSIKSKELGDLRKNLETILKKKE